MAPDAEEKRHEQIYNQQRQDDVKPTCQMLCEANLAPT
jgi:hypothetical protein